VSQQLGALQTHSSSFLNSNFVAISSMPGSVASGTPYITLTVSSLMVYFLSYYYPDLSAVFVLEYVQMSDL
jgi:hypothetical protein